MLRNILQRGLENVSVFLEEYLLLVQLGTAETMEGVMLRNIFRNNIDEKQTVVRKTVKRDNETDKFVCFLTALEQTSGISVS